MRALRLLVAACCLVAPYAMADVELADNTPRLEFELQTKKLALTGAVSSIAHEAILRKVTWDLFPDHEKSIDLEVVPAMAPGWSLISELTLKSMASMRTGSFSLDGSAVTIRGFTRDDEEWQNDAARLQALIGSEFTWQASVVEIRAAGSIQRQCLELFRTALRGRKIEFERASAELRTSAAPLLDELVQIVSDCPGTSLAVTGHTDQSGAASVNQALSQARADAVAGYLESRGLDPSRITATGVGSTEPLVEEESARARQLNRRIDVELVFASGDR